MAMARAQEQQQRATAKAQKESGPSSFFISYYTILADMKREHVARKLTETVVLFSFSFSPFFSRTIQDQE
jgi:hypothetical protein